jgi:ubiquinone/menaquinone biosynthesis C-methylase UbiE
MGNIIDGKYRKAMKTPEQLSAEMYDASVPDWDGEMDFYRAFAFQARDRGQSVLEVACGTGRVTIRLACEGVDITGVDLDEEMLKIAHSESSNLPNLRWVRGDMRSFDLGQTFGLIIVPGHSFQFMCTPEDQVIALETFRRHLLPNGTLIIHINQDDVEWLGDLVGTPGGKFETVCEVRHPATDRLIRKSNAWTYEQYTQTATVVTKWEEIGEDGSILHIWEGQPKALHCVFPFEMEHLLARTGFIERNVYGDFFKNPLSENSPGMIWVARKP